MELKISVKNVAKVQQSISKEVKRVFGQNLSLLVGFPDLSVKNRTGDSIAEYAYKNEMGIGVPRRPFLQPSMYLSKKTIVNYTKINLPKVIEGDLNMRQFFETMGVFLVSNVQQYITDLRQPPNSEWWAAIKKEEGKDTNPLIYTGAMRQAVSAQVTNQTLKQDASYGN